MPALLLVSPEPLAGKTTLAVGLAQRLREQGHGLALLRLAGDEHATADASQLASLPFNSQRSGEPLEPAAALVAAKGADMALIEAPAGDPREVLKEVGSDRALVVSNGSPPLDGLAQYCRSLGDSLAGLILNRVPQRRRESVSAAWEALGLPPPLALLPEERVLAAPTLGDVAQALQAQASFLNDNKSRLLERPLVASISADPGQGYFARYRPSAVIVRGDKPDLQLAALNADAPCLIVTGGLPPLSYVLERAEEEEIPILQTKLDTVAAVQRIEGMFAAAPFSISESKLHRLAELLADLDVAALLAAK